MQEYITGSSIASEILMSLEAYDAFFLLLEGSDDLKFFAHMRIDQEFVLKDCRGRPNVILAIVELQQRGCTRAFAVVDRDFDHLFGIDHASARIAYYDDNDLETTLFFCGAGQKVLSDFITEYATLRQTYGSHHALSDSVIKAAKVFGELRIACRRLHYDISFRAVPVLECIQDGVDTHAIFDRFLQLVNAKFGGISETNRARLYKEVGRVSDLGLCANFACNGHDLVDIICSLLQHHGNVSGRDANKKTLTKLLRLAFSDRDFESTSLSQTIKGWSFASYAGNSHFEGR